MKFILKIPLSLIVLLFGIQLGRAQQGKITIEQDKNIDTLLEIYKSAKESTEHYRIQVGFGSFDQAQEIQMEVEEDFPELPSKIDFDSPTYRVRVGKFKDKLEAERKFLEVREKYPNAMLLKPKKST
ncbi:SPOR domain-containing protein [Ulvibacterium sp.]|uniref:SPOR domain-containing protein n=1 Tax=Ulvibacterium sp. TaxID=2665914 RepID=UPI002612C99E|nr:SPOR domain-containing protein [Ulvibacterium sp.]